MPGKRGGAWPGGGSDPGRRALESAGIGSPPPPAANESRGLGAEGGAQTRGAGLRGGGEVRVGGRVGIPGEERYPELKLRGLVGPETKLPLQLEPPE